MSSHGSQVVPVLKRGQLRAATAFGVLAAVLTLANVVISMLNKGTERRLAEVQSRNQADQATMAQAQDTTRRVALYLRNTALRLDQAAKADPAFGDLLKKNDSGGAFARLQGMIREAAAAPQAAPPAETLNPDPAE